MKKVLLIADIGGHEDQEYYHVGDEAMWYETFRNYQRRYPKWQVGTLSWFPTHSHLSLAEYPHLHWPSGNYAYFPKLILKIVCWRLTEISFFSPAEQALVDTISKHDRVHFSGGGNLSSLFRQWLYYSFFIVIVARSLRKEVIMTSQSIGPITGIDRIMTAFFLNCVNLIAIRAKATRPSEFKKYGLLFPKIRSMMDAAHTLQIKDTHFVRKTKKKLLIGLSLHAWPSWESQTISVLEKTLTALSEKYSFSLILIPHHLVSSAPGPDLEFMNKLSKKLSKKMIISSMDFFQAWKESIPATFVNTVTSSVDLMVTTRYHGVVFGLAQNVPTIALNYDVYYQRKNSGALEMYYGSKHRNYEVNIKTIKATKQLINIMSTVLNNRVLEKRYLKLLNAQITNSNKTLDSILNELERNK